MSRSNHETLSRRIVVAVCGGALAAATALAGCAADKREVTAPPVSTSPPSSAAPSSSPPPPRSTTTPPPPPGAETLRPQGLAGYRQALAQSEKQIDATLASLATLTNPATDDIRGAYDRYSDNLARMRQHEQTIKTEAEAMKAARAEYFEKWEDKTAEIDNPTIRASAEARAKRLRDAHDRIATTSAEARDAYVPFMKDLEDIRTYLAADLSKSSIADLGQASKKVQASGADTKAKIAAVIATLDSIEKGQ